MAYKSIFETTSKNARSNKKVSHLPNPHDPSLREHLLYLLKRGGAHAHFADIMESWPVQLTMAKVASFPHTAWMLLEHIRIAQWDILEFSRNPKRVKARTGWEMPWYTMIDSFDKDFGVDEWHGHNVFFRDGERVFRTYFINARGDGDYLELPRYHTARPSGDLGGVARGLPPRVSHDIRVRAVL
jgi:uncharacterized protein DUF899